MTTTTFKKAIEKACVNFYYCNVIKTMHIEGLHENTNVAIVSLKVKKGDKHYYTIYYKYNTMKHIDYIGYYESLYNGEELIHNGYIDACKEFSEFAN